MNLQSKIDKIFNLATSKDFVKFCAVIAPKAGITPAEWNDSKKKVAFILLMAKIHNNFSEEVNNG